MSRSIKSNNKKNILIIMSDEQRCDTLGCYGNEQAVTPNIDYLAENGTIFNSCFTPYPLCCPARASLWTGYMPHQHHVIGNWRHIREELRDGGLVERFANAGYQTVYTGKWHVPGTNPSRFNFETISAIPAIVKGCDRGRFIPEYRKYAIDCGYDLLPKNMENLTQKDIVSLQQPGKAPCGTSEIPLEDYLEYWQTTSFLEQLEGCFEDKPFFAVCSYNAPHFPMIVPQPYDKLIPPESVILPPNFCSGTEGKPSEVLNSNYFTQFQSLNEYEWKRLIAHYWGFCSMVDAQVGRIIEYLKHKELMDNTIIVYTSDHGDMISSHGLNHKGFPMHYEETIRVPLIVYQPDNNSGQQVDSMVTLMDILPTLADLTGVKLDSNIEGRSFNCLMKDPQSSTIRDFVIVETFLFNNREGGSGEHIDPELFDPENDSMNVSIRTSDQKYIFHWNDIDEYYNLAVDAYEMDNLILCENLKDKILSLQTVLISEIEKSSPILAKLLNDRVAQKAAQN